MQLFLNGLVVYSVFQNTNHGQDVNLVLLHEHMAQVYLDTSITWSYSQLLILESLPSFTMVHRWNVICWFDVCFLNITSRTCHWYNVRQSARGTFYIVIAYIKPNHRAWHVAKLVAYHRKLSQRQMQNPQYGCNCGIFSNVYIDYNLT